MSALCELPIGGATCRLPRGHGGHTQDGGCSAFDYGAPPVRRDVEALLSWHELFGWPAIRALLRARDVDASTAAALGAAHGSLSLMAVGQRVGSVP